MRALEQIGRREIRKSLADKPVSSKVAKAMAIGAGTVPQERRWIPQPGTGRHTAQLPRIHPSFWHSLNRPYFRFWQSSYSIHYGINYRQLPAIEKAASARIKLRCRIQRAALTLRGQKHVYKNIMGSDSGTDEHYIQVRVTWIKLIFPLS